jgi:hypothetical protein
MRTAAQGRAALADELRAQGGTVAEALIEPPAETAHNQDRPGPAQLAASGPRARGHERDYELLLEMIYEGSRLHYGRPRLFGQSDPDLCLLLGDRLYAAGLARLAELGDLEAVAELADLISLLAQAYARDLPDLADAIWAAGATAIGWGASSAHEGAKALARQERENAREALLRAAVPPGS